MIFFFFIKNTSYFHSLLRHRLHAASSSGKRFIERTQSTLCRLRFPASNPVVRGTAGRKINCAKLTLSGNRIGIDHGAAQFPQHVHHRALPRRDSAREPDQEHRALKRKEKMPENGLFRQVCSRHAQQILIPNRQLHSKLIFIRSQSVVKTL